MTTAYLAASDSALAFWTEVLALATVALGAGAFIGAVVAGLAIVVQSRATRRSARLDNIWRLMEYWDSERMWMQRAVAAREIKSHKSASDMTDVFNFFDHVGYLLDEGWIDDESVWSMFADWLLPYWFAAQYAIQADWQSDPLLWRDCERLVERAIRIENKKRRERRMPAYISASEEDIRQLLHGEMGLWPGRPRWRRWWHDMLKGEGSVSVDRRSKELTPDQRLEYTEVNASWRHHESMTAALTAATYPLTFGAFVLALANPSARYVLSIGSTLLYIVYYAIQARLEAYITIRLGRARELEEIGGLQHHRRVYAETPALPWFNGGARVRHIRRLTLAAVVVGWLAVLWFLRTAP